MSYGPKNLEEKTDPHFTGQETEVQSKERITVVVQSLSYVQLCYRMDCSTSAFPVVHYLTEFAQIHVH